MKKFEIKSNEAIVSLEASRSWMIQGIYWLLTAVFAIFDGSFSPTDPPMNLVIRDVNSKKVRLKEGPYFGAEGVAMAGEASRVIEVLGIEGYIHRQRQT
jgi:hypothetical protein